MLKLEELFNIDDFIFPEAMRNGCYYAADQVLGSVGWLHQLEDNSFFAPECIAYEFCSKSEENT